MSADHPSQAGEESHACQHAKCHWKLEGWGGGGEGGGRHAKPRGGGGFPLSFLSFLSTRREAEVGLRHACLPPPTHLCVGQGGEGFLLLGKEARQSFLSEALPGWRVSHECLPPSRSENPLPSARLLPFSLREGMFPQAWPLASWWIGMKELGGRNEQSGSLTLDGRCPHQDPWPPVCVVQANVSFWLSSALLLLNMKSVHEPSWRTAFLHECHTPSVVVWKVD